MTEHMPHCNQAICPCGDGTVPCAPDPASALSCCARPDPCGPRGVCGTWCDCAQLREATADARHAAANAFEAEWDKWFLGAPHLDAFHALRGAIRGD